MTLTRIVQFLAGIAIAGAGVAVFLHGVDMTQLWTRLRGIPVVSVLASIGLFLLTLKLRALRWRVILAGRQARLTAPLYRITVIGYMLNNIFPARLGEAARALLLWRRREYGILRCVGSLLTERLCDGWVFCLYLMSAIFMVPALERFIWLGWLCAAGVAGIAGGLVLYRRFYGLVMRLSDNIKRLLPGRWHTPYETLRTEVLENLNWVYHGRRSAAVMVLSLATIFCYVGVVVLLVHRWPQFGFFRAMAAQCIGTVGAVIPLSPGYIGTVHAFLRFGLTTAGIGAEQAAAVALVYHAIGYVSVTVLGLFYFTRMDISFDVLARAGEYVKKLQQRKGRGDDGPGT